MADLKLPAVGHLHHKGMKRLLPQQLHKRLFHACDCTSHSRHDTICDGLLARQDQFTQRETATPVGQGEQYVTVGCLVPIEEVLEQVPEVEVRHL